MWLLVVAACSQAQAQQAQALDLPLLRINDDGMERRFDLALDEISVKRGEHRVSEMLAANNMVGLLGKTQALRLRENAAQAPGEVEWVIYEQGRRHTPLTRRVITHKLVVQCLAGANAADIADSQGLTLEAMPEYAPGVAVMAAATSEAALDAMHGLRAHPQVASADVLLARWRTKRLIPNDTLISLQWHLRNTGQSGGVLWMDANVTPVWDSFRGAGVTIGVLDDGIQYGHPDLSPNYNAALGYDFNGHDSDPAAVVANDDVHGTCCAGLAVARGNNNAGVCGVAYESSLVAFRLTAAEVTDQDEADAFALHNDVIQIKSSSWGVPDDGWTLAGPGNLAGAALRNGATTGRGGRGTIYVFAGGNGNEFNDNSNYDGYTNSIYTIAVGAINDFGFQSYYSEQGANLHVCAPSSDGRHNAGIVTTDLTGNIGYNDGTAGTADLTDHDYTKTFGGTSAACPVVAGICALMLQANPDLGWRDVQEILMRSARQVHHSDSDWITNGAGIRFNHKYGAGMVDAQAAVAMAQNWINLGPQTSVQVAQTGLAVPIPDNNGTGITRAFNVSAANLRVEHATVTLSISHAHRGDLEVVLTSPTGTVSKLAEQHPDPGADYSTWTFSSVRNWGESAAGVWTLRISDQHYGITGTLGSAVLNVFGSTVEGARVVPTQASLVTEGNLPANAAADPGERVSFSIGLKNIGGADGSNITATLMNLGGVTSMCPPQNYGTLSAGGPDVAQTFSFTAGGASGASSKIVLQLDDNGTPLGYATVQIPLGAISTSASTSAAGIQIKRNLPAVPSPSNLTVSGVVGRVQNVTATLNAISHSRPQDIAVFLGGPANLNIALFTNATTWSLTPPQNLTFDDHARVIFPMDGFAGTGSYRPWDQYYYDSGTLTGFTDEPDTDERGVSMVDFNGLNANGTWRLYVEDYGNLTTGSIGSWSVAVTAVDCTDNIYLTNEVVSGSEASGSIRVGVTRTGGKQGSATVYYATSPGTATAGVDYIPVSGKLTFLAGETTKEISIPIINDALVEPDETFQVTLSAPGGNATLGTTTACTVTILNDDLTAMEGWRQTNFGNSPNGGDLDDYDQDGIVNLLEFAFGLDPKLNSAGQLPQGQRIGGDFVISFTQPSGVSGITYGAEWSTTLSGDWSAIPDAPSGNQHTFRVSMGPHGFMRLKVTNP